MTDFTASYTATFAGLLVGWAEITAYTRKSGRTLRRYRQLMEFPAFRFGRHVVSSPQMIDRWLFVIDQLKRNITRGRNDRGGN
jgi:hypothetical protein